MLGRERNWGVQNFARPFVVSRCFGGINARKYRYRLWEFAVTLAAPLVRLGRVPVRREGDSAGLGYVR